jgi:hypothetical protein
MTPEKIRDQFRTELEFAIAPMREDNRANYEGAIKFADTAIKSAFALNGGALIALPALIALFKIDPQRVGSWVIIAGAVFVVGLIGAAATAFLGYLSAMSAAHSIETQMRATLAKYTALYQQQASPVDVAALERDQVTLGGRSISLRRAAVGHRYRQLARVHRRRCNFRVRADVLSTIATTANSCLN